MKAPQFKGALFEYLIRKLLANCGFFSVQPDNIYTFERHPLFFINGRGAAHDADVLMEPPIQMPFGYPTRLLFECKAYDSKAGLPIVRNALGLKYDINEFEIVTKKSLLERQNNLRASYAVENRNRYVYQVGVASAEGFSKNAFEFAANNKIPLLSLEWILDTRALSLYRSIGQQLVDSIREPVSTDLYNYFKDRNPGSDSRHMDAIGFLEETKQDESSRIGYIISSLNKKIDSTYIGLLESGDLIFLFEQRPNSARLLQEYQSSGKLSAQLHYRREDPGIWYLSVYPHYLNTLNDNLQNVAEFKFYVPANIMSIWKEFNLSRTKSIDIKGEYFSKIFVFNKVGRRDLPVFTINLDRRWLSQVAQAEEDFSRTKQDENESGE
ncbi:MAG: hypothetical protein JW967_01230 [Dehalococcoidales bacterium]|nr:hypothetical protein [Dehalococcoidales bacterium]